MPEHEESLEQYWTKKQMEQMTRAASKPVGDRPQLTKGRCARCGERSINGPEHGGSVFCSDVCLEEWLDSVEADTD